MQPRAEPRVIVIGGSAGGLSALLALIAQLPADLDATVLVVLHTTPRGCAALAEILPRVATMPVAMGRDGQALLTRSIVIIPADERALVTPRRTLALAPMPPHEGWTALDDLLRSAAEALGAATIGVVLSGYLDGGTAGLFAVKAHGGLAMAQDPAEAEVPSMPAEAIARAEVDVVAPAADLGARIALAVAARGAPAG
jgi:two-component system, chemotaxis family, protein-glutamate methylesterase/glutaminase